jgi:hypothetical protein
MVFNNNKSFFLTLDGEAAPAKIDLPTEEIETEENQDTPHEPSAPTLLVAPSDQSGAAPSAPAQFRRLFLPLLPQLLPTTFQ